MKKPSLSAAKAKRDGGGGAVMVLPHCVLDSPAYISLAGSSVRLLLDVAMQYNTQNNGQLLASFRYMSEKRGWTSPDTLARSIQELLDKGLLCKTVQGRLPNRASWYAITWAALDQIKGLEITASGFPRGQYRHWLPPEKNASSCTKIVSIAA